MKRGKRYAIITIIALALERLGKGLQKILEKNKNILVAFAAILCLFGFSAALFVFYVKGRANLGIYAFVAAISIVFLSVLVFILKSKRLSIAGITALVMSILCAICMLIFPPYTAPDENIHYRSAYHISNLQMFNFKDEQNGLYMRECDNEYLVNSKTSLTQQEYIKENNFDSVFAKNKKMVNTGHIYIDNKFLPYFSAGLGITFARIIGLGPYVTFQFARVFNAALLILAVYFAIKIIPFGKSALSAIALIPMTLHIGASCSYDDFTVGGVMLLFAYIMKIMYGEEKIALKQLLILALMMILIIPQKVVYIGVAAILLIIPKEKFALPKWHFAFKCALGILAVGAVLALHFSGIEAMNSETVSYSDAGGYSIGYVLKNPVEIIKMLGRTIINATDGYIISMISCFGWLELSPPWFMIIPYIMLICLAFMRTEKEVEPLGYKERAYSLFLFGMVFLLIEFLLLLDHTVKGSPVILGVQGRYFIPALPLLFLVVRNKAVTLKENFYKYIIFAFSLLNSGMFIYSVARIIAV